ncbi:class I SAM-dependent methyltransferase [Aquimarina sp. W85]|uniref:class I SAM-dependent methyltransferase n=1 Tax=Aquimarina rhodophyticola TaxID=3342246 RepID=UPI003670F8A7
MRCSLCDGKTSLFYTLSNREYYRCNTCDGTQLAPKNRLSQLDEKARYLLHKNDVHDPGYQQFVAPIVDAILKNHDNRALGLDFGCGTGPVIAKLLSASQYKIEKYDPFFMQDLSVLKQFYNYIICCEVIEHFYTPKKEFELLHSLLKPNGKMYCKTNLLLPTINFETWWYKNDSTHVFFYSKNTLNYIKEAFHFETLVIKKDLFILGK